MIIDHYTCTRIEGWRFTVEVDPLNVDQFDLLSVVAPEAIRALEDRFPLIRGELEARDVVAVAAPVNPAQWTRQVGFRWEPQVTAARFNLGDEEIIYQLAKPRTPIQTMTPEGKQLWEWSGWDTNARCWVYKVRP
jgi:hypothetical protein